MAPIIEGEVLQWKYGDKGNIYILIGGRLNYARMLSARLIQMTDGKNLLGEIRPAQEKRPKSADLSGPNETAQAVILQWSLYSVSPAHILIAANQAVKHTNPRKPGDK